MKEIVKNQNMEADLIEKHKKNTAEYRQNYLNAFAEAYLTNSNKNKTNKNKPNKTNNKKTTQKKPQNNETTEDDEKTVGSTNTGLQEYIDSIKDAYKAMTPKHSFSATNISFKDIHMKNEEEKLKATSTMVENPDIEQDKQENASPSKKNTKSTNTSLEEQRAAESSEHKISLSTNGLNQCKRVTGLPSTFDTQLYIPPPNLTISVPTNKEEEKKITKVSTDLQDYEVYRELGSGAFSTVIALSHRKTGRLVACKIMPLYRDGALRAVSESSEDEQTLKPLYMSEVEKMMKLSHENIIKCYGHAVTKSKFLIFLEYASEGTLRNFFKRLPYERRIALLKIYIPHILQALVYIHDQGLVHRDIKPDNILIDKSGRVKLSDFGCSRISEAHSKLSMKGTPEYFAPEILNSNLYQHKYMFAIDTWALGMTIYELAADRHYFHDMERFQIIFHVGSLKEPLNIDAKDIPDENLRSLLSNCLELDASKRARPKDLLNHPFFAECSTTTQSLSVADSIDNSLVLSNLPSLYSSYSSISTTLSDDTTLPARDHHTVSTIITTNES